MRTHILSFCSRTWKVNIWMIVCSYSFFKNVLVKAAENILPGDLFCDKIIPKCSDSVSKAFPLPPISIKINNCYMGLWKTSSVTFEPQRTLFLPLTRPEIKKWVSYENKTFSRKFSSFPSSLWLMYTRSSFSESICLLQTVVYNFENWEIFLSDCFIWFFVFNL